MTTSFTLRASAALASICSTTLLLRLVTWIG